MPGPRQRNVPPRVAPAVPKSVTIRGITLRDDDKPHTVTVSDDFRVFVDGMERTTPLTFSTVKGMGESMTDHAKEFDMLRQIVEGQVKPARAMQYETVYERNGRIALVLRNGSHYILSIRLPLTRQQHEKELQEGL